MPGNRKKLTTEEIVGALGYLVEQGRDVTFHGYALKNMLASRSVSVYGLLAKWVELGMLTESWEAPGSNGGKPARRMYSFTDRGWELAKAQVAGNRE